MNDDPQIAYLAGDDNARVSPAERAEIDKLRDVLADPAVWVEPRADLQERIVATIADSGTRRRSRAIRYAILGSAAAVVLAVGLAIGLNTGNESKPLEYSASLRGTELAPKASGEVTLTKTASGWKIQLHALGLPRRDNGEFYEGWLKNDQGVLVPVGTFNQARRGDSLGGRAADQPPHLHRDSPVGQRRSSVHRAGRAHRRHSPHPLIELGVVLTGSPAARLGGGV